MTNLTKGYNNNKVLIKESLHFKTFLFIFQVYSSFSKMLARAKKRKDFFFLSIAKNRNCWFEGLSDLVLFYEMFVWLLR